MRLLTNIENQGTAYQQFSRYCLENLVPKMVKDVSQYAPKRYRLWLLTEPYLGHQPRLSAAYRDGYLQDVITWLYPGCNTALISYHGQASNFDSNAQINHHRDAGFASASARLLNLGGTADFSYSPCRRNNDPQHCTSYQLNPGDLIEFDCKHLHACTYATPGRIGLIMWQLKPSYHRLAVTSSYL